MNQPLTILTSSAETALAYDDFVELCKEAFPSPRRQLEQFKAYMAERYDIDFDKRCLILSLDFCEEIGLELPADADIHRDGVVSSPFLDGYTMYVMDKPKPFFVMHTSPIYDDTDSDFYRRFPYMTGHG